MAISTDPTDTSWWLDDKLAEAYERPQWDQEQAEAWQEGVSDGVPCPDGSWCDIVISVGGYDLKPPYRRHPATTDDCDAFALADHLFACFDRWVYERNHS
jgi:hypothetical protein